MTSIDNIQEMIANYEIETDLQKKVSMAQQLAKYYLHSPRLYASSHDNSSIGDIDRCELALKYAHQGLQLVEQLKNRNNGIPIFCTLLGSIYERMNDLERAKEYFLRAISVAESYQDDLLLIDPYTVLGKLYHKEFNYSSAFDCFEKAIVASEKHKQKHMLGALYNLVGGTYFDLGEYKKTIHYMRQAIKSQSEDKVIYYVNTGIAYKELKDYTLAIGYFKRVIPQLERENYLDGIAELYCRIADALHCQKKYDKAMEYATKARDFIAEHQINDLQINTILYTVLIKLYLEADNPTEADQYIQRFIDLGVTQLDRLRDFYQVAISFYDHQQRYDLAYAYLLKYNEVNSKLLDEEMKKNMAIRTANFEYERQKQKAELLGQKNEELQRYQRIIEQKNEELLKMHDEKDNLMNTISHDLKNYLGSAQQALEIFNLKEKTMADNKYIKIVSTTTTRSLNLVKEILYSTRIVASKDALSLQTVDINKVIAENEDALLLRGSKKGVSVWFKYSDEPLMVDIDSEKWHRIFENLTTNAIKFTPNGKDIHITTKKDGEYALISIKDSGIGIAPDNISKLFTPFSGVGRKGTDGEESTGLGLSIVKKLVELHGGTIEVTSEVGVGTEFIVRMMRE